MQINYKPQDGWAADFIPFYWQGEYHLFYLKDYRNIPEHGEGTPWCHLVTHDFVHFTDHGECLSRGTQEEQDLYVFTGSVVYGEGRFHIYYTGHNPHLRRSGKPEQAIMHAVSDDLYHWEKVEGELFFAPSDRFEPHDWRDPFVFWNEDTGEYWMLTAARLKEGPSRRRGCTGLCTSKDLKQWAVQDPLYTPDLYFTHECPDLFQMGDWWYLVFSEFSDACVTRYRMARSPSGPWLTPTVDTFDGRAFYAAKTASDGERRFLFGWNPTRVHEKDDQSWQWGGNLVVHEVIQNPDGSLGVRVPETVARSFASPSPVHFASSFKAPLPDNDCAVIDATGAFRCLGAGPLPDSAKIDATIQFSEATHSFGIMLRTSPDFEQGYYVRFEPERSRLVFDTWPRPGDKPHMVEVERPLCLCSGQPVRVTIYVDDSLCEVYANDTVALSARMYDHPQGEWGVFVTDGQAEFMNLTLSTW
jgi:beta-fructofuranosidase